MDHKIKQKASEHQNCGHNQDQHTSKKIKIAIRRSQRLKVSAQGADAHERTRVLAKDADTHKIRKSQDKCHTEGDRKKSESSKKEVSSSDEEFESDSNVSSDEEEIEQSNHNGCGCYSDKCEFHPDECQLFYVDDGG